MHRSALVRALVDSPVDVDEADEAVRLLRLAMPHTVELTFVFAVRSGPHIVVTLVVDQEAVWLEAFIAVNDKHNVASMRHCPRLLVLLESSLHFLLNTVPTRRCVQYPERVWH